MVKYVLIDMDDTLCDFFKSANYAIEKMFNQNGFPYDKDTLKVYREVCDPLWNLVEKRELTLKELQKVRWSKVFERLNINAPSGDYEAQYRKNLSETVFLIDGAKELLKYLSSKYTVCVATNSHYNQQMSRLKLAGLDRFVHHLFTSNEIGYEKPYKEFYRVCLEKLNNPNKSEVIMIGDSLNADVKGAYEFGIKSIWFNAKQKDISSPYATYTVDSLLKIKDIL